MIILMVHLEKVLDFKVPGPMLLFQAVQLYPYLSCCVPMDRLHRVGLGCWFFCQNSICFGNRAHGCY